MTCAAPDGTRADLLVAAAAYAHPCALVRPAAQAVGTTRVIACSRQPKQGAEGAAVCGCHDGLRVVICCRDAASDTATCGARNATVAGLRPVTHALASQAVPSIRNGT